MVYVRIKKINNRLDHFYLGFWLNQSGVGEVDYNEGGWNDRGRGNVAPHLKFENHEDAVAYVLANGGKISKTIPEVIGWENN